MLTALVLALPLPEPVDSSPPVELDPLVELDPVELPELASIGAEVIGGVVVNGEVSAIGG